MISMLLLTILFINILLISITQTQKHDIIIERAEKMYIDTKYGDFNVTVSRISRKEHALTIFISVYENVYASAYVNLQIYALFSNEYRKMPASLSKSICNLMNDEWQWVANDVLKVSNIPRYCPVPIGEYYVKKYVLNSKNIPEMPWERMMMWGNITLELKDRKEKLLVGGVQIFVRYNRDEIFLRKFGMH